MRTQISVLCGLFFLALSGCSSGSSSNDGPPAPPVQGLLSPVSDAAAFETALKNGLTAMASSEQLAAADAAAGTAGNYTGTYTQEFNVDEFDVVRYDGEHLYVAPRRYFHCCFVLAEADALPADPTPEPERSIRLLATNPATGSAAVVGTIPVENEISVQGLYVDSDRLFALTARAINGNYGPLWFDLAVWEPEKLGFRLYDVSNKANPVLQVEATIDGVFVESRRIGNTVYIVSRYTPWVEGLDYYAQTPEQQAANAQALANATLEDLLPKITIGNQTSLLVTPERCYVTTDDEVPYAVITSVTAIPLDDPQAFSTTCYNEQAYGAYVSASAIYFTETVIDRPIGEDATRIHKFALAGSDVNYRGSAEVDGSVWRGGQADFRMSEHDGNLRLLASQFSGSNDDFVDHHLYVLRESASGPTLEVVSTLPNARRPAEIGKPNEALYGVRFLGDVAYAVTFEQIDPLYAIDLGDPADPYIAGELQVTGFSDFLHPVNDNLLLGLGRSQEGAIKVELFDVSNIAQPLSRGSAVIGGRGSFSEAFYDRHAFAYQADVSGVDRFTIPAHIYADDNTWRYRGSTLHLFEILDKDMPSLTTLNAAGVLAPPSADPEFPDLIERSRAFIHDDTVFYVRDGDVWSAFWQSPSVLNGPF